MKLIKFTLLTLVISFAFTNEANAQFLKKLKEKVQKAAEETVINKTAEKTAQETGKAMDSILFNDSNNKSGQNQTNTTSISNTENKGNANGINSDTSSQNFEIYSKFDFVPGDKILLLEDFSLDNIGDFPAKWNTNGSGEVVTINDSSEKWVEFKPGYSTYYIPDLPQVLPEEYTIEFDLLAVGIDNKTSSTAVLLIILDDNNTFKNGQDYAFAHIPFVQYIAIGVKLKNKISGQNTISNTISGDLRQAVLNKPHISIAVNKQRYRLWVNEKKYVDIPRLIGKNAPLKALKFNLTNFQDNKEHLFITNLKIAEGGQDLRSKLLNEGKFSTTGILFNSGSDKIKPESYGVLKQIANVLKQEQSINLIVIGHTDADGNDDANLKLSQQRATSVKNKLVSQFGIDKDRLQTDGKGESNPVNNNSTPEGKANNRRVEFIKL